MPFKIFLSSTYCDLIAERQAVEQVIVALGQHFNGMEHFFAREETPLETCLAEVARSHWLVLVVGQRYGATDTNGISYTEREYLCAGELNIPRFVFLQDDAVTDAPRDDDLVKRESVKRFRADLMARHTVAFFKNPDELATQVALTLAREITKQVAAARGLMPPPPPEIFVGRQDELRDIAARLRANGAVGIAGVRGLGGIGKSALATVFAYAHIAEYPDGLLWVTLAGRDPLLLLSDIANVFGEDVSRYADVAGRAARVRALLDGKRALLILDDARKDDLPHLPHLQMHCPTLITTRLETLSIVPPRAMLSLEILSEDDALALCREVLGDRVERERDGFAALCRAAGYLPLALNILLRRLFTDKGLSVEELTQRVADRKRAIKEVSKSDDPNLNVRASFDLSYDVLSEWDPKLFRALGVFDGPDFSAEMTADILGRDVACNVSTQNDMADDVRDGLDNLAQYALIERAERGRFRLHPLLQSYAQNLLSESGEEARVREQAASAYLEFAQSHSEPAGWNGLEVERENILSILATCKDRGWHQTLTKFAGNLEAYLFTRGYWTLYLYWLEQTTVSFRQLGDKRGEAAILHNIAGVAWSRGDVTKARENLNRVLELDLELGDNLGHAETQRLLGLFESDQGNYAVARTFYEQALVLEKELGDKQGTAATLHALGNIETNQGNYAVARTFYEQALALAKELGDKQLTAATVHALGAIEAQQGNYAAARTYYEQSLAIRKELGEKQGTAATLHELGRIESNQGNYAAARTFFEQSLALQKELGDKRGMAGILQTLGMLELNGENREQAERNFREGLAIAQQIGDKYWIASHQYSLASVEARKGNRAPAVELARAALALWEELHAPEAQAARELLAELGQDPKGF